MTTSRAALTFVLLSVFIDSVGFGIIIPSIQDVIMELTGQPLTSATRWGGLLMAVYAALQFVIAPIFGALSDRYGRRPVLLASLFAFGVDFLLTGLATSMLWLFLGRAFAGVFGASFATANAYVGDISSDADRAKNFGFIGAAWGLGFTLGPVIGGVVSEHFGIRAPFFVAAGLAELAGTLPDAHVYVLQHLLGHRAPAQHAQQPGEQDGGGLVVQRPEGAGVLGGTALQELGELDFGG